MAYSNSAVEVPFVSEADLSAKSYLVAITGTAAQTAAVSGLSGVAIGIFGDISQCTASGKPCGVVVSGVTKLMLGATVLKDAILKSDAHGKGTTADTDKDNVIAQALEAGDSGDIISVLITRYKASI